MGHNPICILSHYYFFFFFFLGLHVSTENVCFKTAYQLGPFCLFINRLDVLCVVPVKEPETFFSFNSMCLRHPVCAHRVASGQVKIV